MKQFLFLFIACVTGYTAQENTTAIYAASLVYTGSTPGGAYIKSLLKIAPDAKCEFIKWNLALQQNNDSFKVVVHYGESQPNTTGFKNGGVTSGITGSYIIKKAAESQPGKEIIVLQSSQLESNITLLRLDERLLYFTDNKGKLLVGNGGFSYLLNRQP